MELTGTNNDTIGLSITTLVNSLFNKIKPGYIILTALLTDTRNHFRNRYPGSSNFSPNKVLPDRYDKNSGSVNISAKGIGRNFHDVIIKPITANYLTIPLHGSAYGLSTREFESKIAKKLFRPKNKNILAINDNGSLVAIYALAKQAYQHQDSTLLPSDDEYAINIFSRIEKALQDIQN